MLKILWNCISSTSSGTIIGRHQFLMYLFVVRRNAVFVNQQVTRIIFEFIHVFLFIYNHFVYHVFDNTLFFRTVSSLPRHNCWCWARDADVINPLPMDSVHVTLLIVYTYDTYDVINKNMYLEFALQLMNWIVFIDHVVTFWNFSPSPFEDAILRWQIKKKKKSLVCILRAFLKTMLEVSIFRRILC